MWRQEGAGALTPAKPVTLTWDNGEGLDLPPHHRGRRQVPVHRASDEVANKGAAPVTLFPYALISRHGTPKTDGYYILHEGLIGVIGDQGLKEESYKSIEDKKAITFKATNGWLGITDKYWAATLLPDTKREPRRRASRPAPPARPRPTRPTTCSTRRRSRRARPAPPTCGCSPAPRRCRPSTPTTRRSGSTASSC